MPGDQALRLLIDITARDSASSIIRSLAGVFTGLQGGIKGVMIAGMELLGLFTLIAAAVAIALGVAATRAAANFQQGLNRLVTGAGDVTDNMQKMGQAILGVSVKTGVAANDLLTAMYHILSVGQRGAQALDTLAAASEGAQIEMAKVADVANILVILQTNFGIHTYTATQYMNGLIVAVAHGNITLEALSTAMAPILPLAHQLGISFMDVAAAMSVQTNAGLDARKSATGLQAIFVALENPTKKAELAMRALGVSSVAVANEMKTSLPGAFQMLIDAALKVGPIGSVAFNRAMMDMVGGGTRTAKSITALSQNMKAWTADIKAMSIAMHLSTQDVMGWDVASSGFNIQMDRSKAAVQALLIVIGTRLLPILTKLLTQITPLIVAFAQWFLKTDPLGKAMAWLATAFDKVRTAAITLWNFLVPIGEFIGNALAPLFKAIGVMIQTVLVPAWNNFVAAVKPLLPQLIPLAEFLGGVLVAAIILVGGIILGVIVIIGLLIAAFLWIIAAIVNVANWVNTACQNIIKFFQNLFHALVGGSIIPELIAAIVSNFASMPGKIMAAIASLPGKLAALFLSIASAAVGWGRSIINNFLAGLQAAWNAVVSWVNSALSWLKSHFPGSPVKMGPLMGYENWGYTFGMGIADGIRRSIPAVQSASSLLASAVGGGYSGSYSMSFGGSRYPTGGSVVVNHITIMPPSIKLDGAEVVDKISRRQAKEIRVQGWIKNK